MRSRYSAGRIALALGLGATVVLATFAILTWLPVHRSPIQIVDPLDPEMAPDFDALLLQGERESGDYVVTLSVAGVAQASRYVVGILVQDLGRPGDTYVYSLELQFDEEENYGIQTARAGSSLTFWFPLDRLGRDTYIVGLDAVSFGDTSDDYVVEGPRENLRIERLLPLPIDPALFAAAPALALIGTLVLGARVLDRSRQGGDVRP